MKIAIHKGKKPLDGSIDSLMLTKQQLDVSGQHPKLVGFTVTQMLFWKGRHPIIRYDCAHGYLDEHRFYRDLHDRTEHPEKKASPELYQECKKDILQNWAKYRDLYIQKWLSD